MNSGRGLFTVVCVFVVFLGSVPAFAGGMAEKKAVEASAAWLKLVDDGHYAKSWDTAAAFFRNAVSREQWIRSLDAVREPLGKVLKRSLISQRYAKSLPGAPDGEYVVIQYQTSFKNKQSATETITPTLDKDGKWRVSGYYIR